MVTRPGFIEQIAAAKKSVASCPLCAGSHNLSKCPRWIIPSAYKEKQ